jgi:hypothetical protein
MQSVVLHSRASGNPGRGLAAQRAFTMLTRTPRSFRAAASATSGSRSVKSSGGWLGCDGEGRDQVRPGGRLSISHCTQGVPDDVVVVEMQASLVGRSPG